MLKYMLDTNIVIYTNKRKPSLVKEALQNHYGQVCISEITLMELIYGAEKSTNPSKNITVIEGFTSRIEVFSYDNDAAIHTGQIRAELAKKGTPIGPYDQMIAGHARSRGLVLVTNNTRKFERIEGLRLENWTK